MMNTIVSTDAYERIGAFLSQYVRTNSGGILPHDVSTFKKGIKMLLESKTFESEQDMKLECLRDYSIIIPDFLFGKDYPDE